MNGYFAWFKCVVGNAAGALAGEVVLAGMPLVGRGTRFVELVGAEEFQVAVVEQREGYIYLEKSVLEHETAPNAALKWTN